jgi:hypothetical protein
MQGLDASIYLQSTALSKAALIWPGDTLLGHGTDELLGGANGTSIAAAQRLCPSNKPIVR